MEIDITELDKCLIELIQLNMMARDAEASPKDWALLVKTMELAASHYKQIITNTKK
ncbi:MAG: hypothetical protein AAFP77_31255 [Bacteroidota bacterium]